MKKGRESVPFFAGEISSGSKEGADLKIGHYNKNEDGRFGERPLQRRS